MQSKPNLFLLGFSMVKVQKKVSYGLNVLQYYTMKPWNFKNENYLSLKNSVSKEDNETFFTNLEVSTIGNYTDCNLFALF